MLFVELAPVSTICPSFPTPASFPSNREANCVPRLRLLIIMAAPFVYVPEASPTVRHNPFYSTPQRGQSPFLPPAALLYPPSPYSAPGTPESFNANSVIWLDNAPQYESAYTASWAPLSNRKRTISWHGPAPAAPSSPFLQPTAPAFVHSQSAFFTPGHRRSSSWGAAGAPPPPS